MVLTGYNLVSIADLISQIGHDRTKEIMLDFSCPLNKDVEYFLKSRAIEFSNQGISKTHLVYTSYKDKPVICGYFTLCSKPVSVAINALSNTMQKRINKFCIYNVDTKRYDMSAHLIAQLGKNYTNGYDKLIRGDELLQIALDKLGSVYQVIGGKFVYIECEDNPKLIRFYADNGFVNFGKRMLDKEEEDRVKGRYLIQMLKYLNGSA